MVRSQHIVKHVDRRALDRFSEPVQVVPAVSFEAKEEASFLTATPERLAREADTVITLDTEGHITEVEARNHEPVRIDPGTTLTNFVHPDAPATGG